MVIFNSYVKLPEGNHQQKRDFDGKTMGKQCDLYSNNGWLVVTGTWLDDEFLLYWEVLNFPTDDLSYFSEG